MAYRHRNCTSIFAVLFVALTPSQTSAQEVPQNIPMPPVGQVVPPRYVYGNLSIDPAHTAAIRACASQTTIYVEPDHVARFAATSFAAKLVVTEGEAHTLYTVRAEPGLPSGVCFY